MKMRVWFSRRLRRGGLYARPPRRGSGGDKVREGINPSPTFSRFYWRADLCVGRRKQTGRSPSLRKRPPEGR